MGSKNAFFWETFRENAPYAIFRFGDFLSGGK